MRYAYYPGCSAKVTCPELHHSTIKVAEKLGIELIELDSASCCGAGVINEANPDLNLALNARNLALAEQQELYTVLTICCTCQHTLADANKRLKNNAILLSKINNVLSKIGLKYNGKVAVKHFLWILIEEFGLEKLRKYVVTPLNGLKIAPFYGCHLLRPKEVLGFDDPEKPTSLDQLIELFGGKPVEYNGKTKCCGFHLILAKQKTALKMAGKNLQNAKEMGAECMVTPCPLCHMALDIYQQKIEGVMRAKINLPVLHLPQLVGLAMGLSMHEIKLSTHIVSAEKLFHKIGK